MSKTLTRFIYGTLLFMLGCVSTIKPIENQTSLKNVNPPAPMTSNNSAQLALSRDPANSTVWALREIEMATAQLNGKCDLSPTAYIRRSSILSQTTIIAGLSLPADNFHKGCQLNSQSFAPAQSAVLFSASYSPLDPSKISLVIKIGDLEYANNEAEDAALSSKGYHDVHLTGAGVYKMKDALLATYSGACERPTLVGIYGFRKQVTQCSLQNGQVKLSLIETNP